MSIDRIESMALFGICDLTHWATWGDLLFIWKQKYYLPAGGNCFVLCNSTGGIGSEVINGYKRGSVDVAWTLQFCVCGVTHEWMPSVFEALLFFWYLVLSFLSSWDDMDVPSKLLTDNLWASEDDKIGFLSVDVDIFYKLYL